MQEVDKSDLNQVQWFGKTFDLSKAYKQLAVFPEHQKHAIVGFPAKGSWRFYKSFSLPFGCTGSVYGFVRISQALWFIVTKLLFAITSHYFDDFPTIERSEGCRVLSLAFSAVLDMLGWVHAKEGDKALNFAEAFDLLGVTFDLTAIPRGLLVVSNKLSRVEKLCHLLDQIAADGTVSVTRASEIQGLLNFAVGYYTGKSLKHLVSAFMPFADKAHPARQSDLSDLCNYAKHMLRTLKQRGHSVHGSTNPVLIFTDGAWEAGVATAGAVLIDGSERLAFSITVPDSLKEHWLERAGEQIICQVELWALLVIRWTFREKLLNRRVLEWIDNESARMSAIKANSPSGTMRSLTRLLADIEVCWPAFSWIERVCSFSNPGDLPSRNKVAEAVAKYHLVDGGTLDASAELSHLVLLLFQKPSTEEGIETAFSIFAGKADVSWGSARLFFIAANATNETNDRNLVENVTATYFLLCSEEDGNLENITKGLEEMFGDGRGNVSLVNQSVFGVKVLDLGHQAGRVQMRFQPKSTQFLLVLAVVEDKMNTSYISDNREIQRISISAEDPVLADGVQLVEVIATEKLDIEMTNTSISFAVAEALDLPHLPVLQTGSFVTGVDSDGEPFFLRIMGDLQVSQGGLVIEADVLPATVEEAYDKLTLDGFFSSADSSGLSLLSNEPEKSNLELKGTVQLKAGVAATLGLQIKPAVKLKINKVFGSLEFSVNFTLRWSYGITIVATASEELSVKQAVNIPTKLKLRFPLWAGLFMVVKPKLSIEAEAIWKGSVNMQFGVEYGETHLYQVERKAGGNWSSSYSRTPIPAFPNGIKLDGGIVVNVGPIIEIDCLVNGLLGLKISFIPRAVFEVEAVVKAREEFLVAEDYLQGAHVSKFELGTELVVGFGLACNDAILKRLEAKCGSLPPAAAVLCEEEQKKACPGLLRNLTFKPDAPLFKLPTVRLNFELRQKGVDIAKQILREFGADFFAAQAAKLPDLDCFFAGEMERRFFPDSVDFDRLYWLEDYDWKGEGSSVYGGFLPAYRPFWVDSSRRPERTRVYFFVSSIYLPAMRILAETPVNKLKLARCRRPPAEDNVCGRKQTCPNDGGAVGSGDPQCLTYDGLRFECNFLGEAVWTKCDDFAVHVFAEKPNDSSRATVIKGLAVTEGGEIITAVLREGATEDGAFDFAFDGDEEKLLGNHISVTLEGDQTLLVRTVLGHELIAIFEPTHVSLEIALDRRCFNRTEGLMGNYNGNPADDLRPFNSTKVMAETSSTEDIYEQYVLSWCTDDIQDSLFPLELFKPCDRTHWPLFTSNLDLDACPASCQGDRFCCLDFSEVGADLALPSLAEMQYTIELQTLARTLQQGDPPRLSLPTETC
eukprot:s1919_g6.t1